MIKGLYFFPDARVVTLALVIVMLFEDNNLDLRGFIATVNIFKLK
jgi:hypothetical protein